MTKQYAIPMNEVADDFVRCWQSAGQHLQSQIEHGALNFFRANLTPPFLEHLSFRLGNQIFFIHVTDDEEQIVKPSTVEATLTASEMGKGIPCLMVMQRTMSGWEPKHGGWGLTHAVTGEMVSPLDLVSDELIEMSDWELQDFAIQIVKDHLEKEGCKVNSTASDPNIDPQIWFEGTDGGFHYAVVRGVRYPAKEASLPHNIESIMDYCKQKTDSGYFGSVRVANADEAFDPAGGGMPLWRGHGLMVGFDGLIPLSNTNLN